MILGVALTVNSCFFKLPGADKLVGVEDVSTSRHFRRCGLDERNLHLHVALFGQTYFAAVDVLVVFLQHVLFLNLVVDLHADVDFVDELLHVNAVHAQPAAADGAKLSVIAVV